ncbi:MAG: Outer membrane protein assembly factor BamD [Syntrophaceae bacterium PtaU1.Bin231]|nr:MAG: Outer membrane protein assembly factor BamD [Syntrophaceae bacterium PtaU1.Bin231]
MSGCAHFYEGLAARPDFEQAENFARQGDYDTAASKYEEMIGRHPLIADEALFQMGILYVTPQNRHRNYQKALECFQRLIDHYPESGHRRDSVVLASLLHEISSRDRKVVAQGRQIEKLEQQVEEIGRKLERIKEVDMQLKQRKKRFR